jgi:hypothetical protein
MLKKMGISDVKFLLFLRDPINNALSLYKHRAKNGNALDIEEWPKKHYVYGGALVAFLKQAQLEKINLVTRKFSKEKGALEKVLFKGLVEYSRRFNSPSQNSQSFFEFI